jgi:hypothetical protein
MRPISSMSLRSLARWLFVASCALAALVVSRPAHAVAPICDERGASMAAPPPALPMTGDSFDVVAALPFCFELDRGLSAVGPDHDAARRTLADEAPTGAVVTPALHPSVADVGASVSLAFAQTQAELPSGYAPDVFHPPRP